MNDQTTQDSNASAFQVAIGKLEDDHGAMLWAIGALGMTARGRGRRRGR